MIIYLDNIFLFSGLRASSRKEKCMLASYSGFIILYVKIATSNLVDLFRPFGEFDEGLVSPD